jgi:hypothetical protein
VSTCMKAKRAPNLTPYSSCKARGRRRFARGQQHARRGSARVLPSRPV